MKRGFSFRILNAVLGILMLAGSLSAQDLNPVGMVTIRNTQTFSENILSIAQESGDIQGSMPAAIFQAYVSQKLFMDAVDVQRPVGLFLYLVEGQDKPLPVLVLPIQDVDKASKLLPPCFKFESMDADSWKVFKVGEEDGVESKDLAVCVYRKGNWCFVTQTENEAIHTCDGSHFVQMLTEEAAGYDFGMTLFVNEIPESDRQNACAEIVQKVGCELEKHQKCFGDAMMKFFQEKLEKFAASAKENHYESPITAVRLGYSWDKTAKKVIISNSFTGDAQNGQIQDLSRVVRGGEYALAGFGSEGSLASMQFNASISEMNDAVVGELLAMRREQMRKIVTQRHGEEAAKEIMGFFEENGELFRAAFFGPEMEAAGAIFVDPETLTLVGARMVPDGYALEKEFQKAVEYVKVKKGEKLEKHMRDAKRVEEGDLHIYQADFVPKCEQQEKHKTVFQGKIATCVIFTPNAVYYAAGTNACETLKKCIAESKAADAPAFSCCVNVQNFMSALAWQANIPEDVMAKVRDAGEGDVTVKMVSLENGVEFVTEVPAVALRIMVLCRDFKQAQE